MIRKIDSNKFSLTILKVTTFSRIRQIAFTFVQWFYWISQFRSWKPIYLSSKIRVFSEKICSFELLSERISWKTLHKWGFLIIRLGDLGDFSILLSSKGAEFKNLIADAEFNLNGKVSNYQIQKKIDCLTTTNLLLTLII